MRQATHSPAPATDGGGGESSFRGSGAKRRVLIVEDETLVGIGLKSNLERLGHEVVGQAANAAEAMALFRDTLPDLVLMDIRLDGSDGITLASQLLKERRCPMIILSAYSDRELVDRASAAGVYGYLIKPVSAEALAAQIAVAVRRFAEQEKLIRENAELSAQFETRKLIDRAKGIFMKRLKIDEPEAHKRLQQESQKRRISLPELAKRIIEAEEMMGG
jgi:AmiR/NasT family two-component response regulator